jgi:NADH:ubiquinone oxidoreductase subunit C
VNLEPLLSKVPSATVSEEYGPAAVDVPPEEWVLAVTAARDVLGCTFFDFLSAVDEGDGFRLVCHVVSPRPFGHVVLRTLVGHEAPQVASLMGVYAGAGWHERETAEMFGIEFLSASGEVLELPRLLLSEELEGHPLRKDFLLQSRLERPWPGARPPGVPETP